MECGSCVYSSTLWQFLHVITKCFWQTACLHKVHEIFILLFSLFFYFVCSFHVLQFILSWSGKASNSWRKNSRGLCWELQRISWKNLFEDLLDCCFTVQSEVYRIKINAFSAHRLDFICTDNFEDSKSTILTAPFVWSGKTIVLFFCFVLFFSEHESL